MAERPAPLILVPPGTQPDPDPAAEPPPGSYRATLVAGRELLAAELSRRLGRSGAAVAPLPRVPAGDGGFHWGAWFTAEARRLVAAARASGAAIDAVGYAGGGALALAGDSALDELLSPLAGEAVANNRFSADAFVVAGDLDRALTALAGCPVDNVAARTLAGAGFGVRDLAATPWSRFDVDTPLDLALLRLATRLPDARRLDPTLAGFLEMATLPGGRQLEVPRLAALGEVVRDRAAELLVAGRVPAAVLGSLERETACRVRAVVEERGMRAAPAGAPRSLLAGLLRAAGPRGLVAELARLGDGVVLDSRVLMAALAGSSDAAAWPAAEERFASDFGDAGRVATPWLAELTAAADEAAVPILLGGHGLVSDGLRIVVGAAWLGH